ncbi:cupin domain-containing protein [Aestuariibacter sp. AA17]|uniref:Cupin domain-containing protein n=1 Tax=Fluctibacter corallii TaxID=2984329 RepID=A0ABT3A6E8_9ALTE|nr:cupin domain-containing protein [Aestuariibacter sp. AA17]MCV2884224.1 cupin domain-containing protein [Aestuariibacter sp. AA17]
MSLPNIEALITALGLERHIEGGYFAETFRSDKSISFGDAERAIQTSIYYLLTHDAPIGHFHKNRSDIVHYYHGGDPIDYFLLNEDGELEQTTLGFDIIAGHKLQLVVKGGKWKASRLRNGVNGYGLIGEAVAPGFDYQDMQLGDRESLMRDYPGCCELITQLTRESV